MNINQEYNEYHPEMNEAPIPQDFFVYLIQKRRSYACLAISEICVVY